MTMQLEQVAHEEITYESPSHSEKNVGIGERLASIGTGSWLMLRGLRHPGIPGVAIAGVGALLVGRGMTGRCPMYRELGVNTQRGLPPNSEEFEARSLHVTRAFLINKPASELFAFWRNFENLPRFMTHLKEVQSLDGKRSKWKANAPAGFTVEWEAEIINEEPDQLIAWQSLEGSDIHHAGSIRFDETADRGTEVRVILDYIPPMGRLGAAVARIFGEEPKQQIREDLRRFKQLMESGETANSAGPRGACGRTSQGRSGL